MHSVGVYVNLDPAGKGIILIERILRMATDGCNTACERANVGFRQRIDHTWFNSVKQTTKDLDKRTSRRHLTHSVRFLIIQIHR